MDVRWTLNSQRVPGLLVYMLSILTGYSELKRVSSISSAFYIKISGNSRWYLNNLPNDVVNLFYIILTHYIEQKFYYIKLSDGLTRDLNSR